MTLSALVRVGNNHTSSREQCHAVLRRMTVWLMVFVLLLPNIGVYAATEHHGQVTFGGLPVPGVTITATQGDKTLTAITDQAGGYSFPDLPDGMWTFHVEMLGFASQTQDVTVAADMPTPNWELKLLPFEEITKGIPLPPKETPPPAAPGAAANGGKQVAAAVPAKPSSGFQRAAVNASNSNNAPAPAAPAPPPPSDDQNQSAATSLVVNGSVVNGAATPFAQAAAFGNNRRGPASLYNGFVSAAIDTSAWDANSFSQTGLPTPKPFYNDTQLFGVLGGPLGTPHHPIRGSNFFVGYTRATSHTAVTQWGRVPTLLERAGDLSQTMTASGQPVKIFNPATGQPFAGGMIPSGQISPQAQALLNEYPLPNVTSNSLYNYQAPELNANHQDIVQSRLSQNLGRNQFFGTLSYQRAISQATSLFGFDDNNRIQGMDIQANWTRQMARSWFVTFKYEFSRLATDATPFFANRQNISGAAGIQGNDQQPVNWGPPALNFSSDISPLSDVAYTRNANQTSAFSNNTLWYHRSHATNFGADVRRQEYNILSQQDARGTLLFNGAATQATSNGLAVAGTGSDLADFLLGIPDTSSIAFGNADKYLRGWTYDAFITDDWRVNSGFTLDFGVRWEFAEPFTELHNRLVNLDIAPNFTAASPVLASNPTGAITGEQYSTSLLHPDYRGIEPRIGIAWRPRPASTLVVRGGYGVYDNTSVYQYVAMQLAQQAPLSKTLSVQNSPANPLTLANPFSSISTTTPNTFAVDPNFRIGYAQNWTASVQQDIPGSMTMTLTYFGTKGTRLMQEYLPNTFPTGAVNPCPACPAGFVYLGSNGNSTREAGQIQLRRRLRNGFTATLQYTYAKALDDASAFSGGAIAATGSAASGAAANTMPGGSGPGAVSIAQNWLDLAAERGPSTFDQRHQLNFQLQYTSGEGLHGGALLGGWRGTLLKEWTFTTQLVAGSGLPLTPIYLTNVVGTGVFGTVRANYTGAPVYSGPAGTYLNPTAYTAPLPGQWGNAGRNSIVGPAQFSLNASMGRTFRLGNRMNADWRIDATNALNVVTYTAWNATVTSPLFGLPTQANNMRKLQTTFRVRF